MRRLRSSALPLAIAVLSLWSFSGCGGSAKRGAPLFPARVNLSPGAEISLVLGATVNFTASASSGSTNLSTPITFASSDTSILTLAPNGVACAGHWDLAFTTCTPGATGPVKVTATALGATSVPTYVFVHSPIDSISVTGVVLDGVPVQEPCQSQSQSMTVEAHAFSQGVDITAAVGPFSFSSSNSSVVNLSPVVDSFYNFPTNHATATALVPGITRIIASAGGVSSSTFQQPQYQNSLGATSPALDFYETCPIQSISLELGATGSQQSGQTSFVAAKGSTQNATAVLTDVMGNSSLPNTNGDIVLSKIPLTWSSSQPGVLSASAGCLEACSLATPLPGSGSVTASCSPPTCNIGFPLVPASLSTSAALDACTQFFHAQYPKLIDCRQLIPAPVYADTAISGILTGTTGAASVLATSTGCAHEPPAACSAAVYDLSTAKASAGPANPFPTPPNSILFDPTGAKAYVGSDFGAQLLNPGNLGSSSSAFTSISTVTGKVLATSPNGSFAVFSDLIHIPNQVYIVNAGNTTSIAATALNISGATAAAFSPDGLKAFILGPNSPTCTHPGCLYVYSTLQALQTIALSAPATGVTFSSTGAFAFLNGGSSSSSVTAVSTCDNSLSPLQITLPSQPLMLKVMPVAAAPPPVVSAQLEPLGLDVLLALDNTGLDIIATNSSGGSCPRTIALASNSVTHQIFTPQRVDLGQGTIQPVNFFTSGDGSQIYIASASSASILVYSFDSGSVTGIELLGNATPISADMAVDAGTIVVAGSDGLLHQITTALGGSDQVQLSFPDLPNFLNPFCSFTPTAGPCTLDKVAVRP